MGRPLLCLGKNTSRISVSAAVGGICATIADPRANRHAQKRHSNANHDLVQAEQLEAKRHAQAIDSGAAHHRRNRAHLVRSLEEERAHKNPAKCRFKTAEREHVDLQITLGGTTASTNTITPTPRVIIWLERATTASLTC